MEHDESFQFLWKLGEPLRAKQPEDDTFGVPFGGDPGDTLHRGDYRVPHGKRRSFNAFIGTDQIEAKRKRKDAAHVKKMKKVKERNGYVCKCRTCRIAA